MASTSAYSSDKVKKALNDLSSENQPTLSHIRKTITTLQEVAVEMEKLNRTDKVKELEDAVIELLYVNEECTSFSDVMNSIGEKYQPGPQLTDFKKLIDSAKSKIKGQSAANIQKEPLLRRFREAVWNVHHRGQPMPGEEQEDIVMTSTQVGLLNTVCPITGKAVTDLVEPVRSTDCKHVFEKEAILLHIKFSTKTNQCPVAGCPKPLHARKLICDQLLPVEIEELRSQNKQTEMPGAFEDFTTFSDEESM